MRCFLLISFCTLAVACGQVNRAPQAEPAEETVPARAVVERLLEAIDGDNLDAMVAAFHPTLRESVRRELRDGALSTQMPEFKACLQRTLDRGVPHSIDVPDALGTDATTFDVEGVRDSLVSIQFEGTWYILDTGC